MISDGPPELSLAKHDMVALACGEHPRIPRRRCSRRSDVHCLPCRDGTEPNDDTTCLLLLRIP